MDNTRVNTENNASFPGKLFLQGQKSNGKETELLAPRHDRVREQVGFAQLPDGSLVELTEDPEDPRRTLLAVFKDGNVHTVKQIDLGSRILVVAPKNSWPMEHLVLPRGAQPYSSTGALLHRIEDFITRCVHLPSGYAPILANFVLATWIVDFLPIAPYLAVIGLPQTGKTTLLKVLSLLCRRSLLTADISSAALYEVSTRFQPTLLLDEVETHQWNSVLRLMLRTGTVRGVVSFRRGQVYEPYGAKVLSFIEPPDDSALNSRCIQVPLFETNNIDLLKPTDPLLLEMADRLRMQFLRFRFEMYGKIRFGSIPGSEALRPRSRDLLACLAAPSLNDPNRCQRLLEFFRFRDATNVQPLPPAQAAVLKALMYGIHSSTICAGMPLLVNDFAQSVNRRLEQDGERLRVSPRKVGSALTSLGIKSRQRTNRGWLLWLGLEDLVRVHKIGRLYGLDQINSERHSQLKECPLCKDHETKHGQIIARWQLDHNK